MIHNAAKPQAKFQIPNSRNYDENGLPGGKSSRGAKRIATSATDYSDFTDEASWSQSSVVGNPWAEAGTDCPEFTARRRHNQKQILRYAALRSE
jgi:hypothetical protein